MAKPRKRGDTWYYTIEAGIVDGKRKRITRGGFKTKKAAELERLKAIEEVENGGFIDQSNISLSDYLDFWYKEYVTLNCRHYTKISYLNSIRHIKNSIGGIKLKKITPAIIQKFINEEHLKYAHNTTKSRLIVLKSSLKQAVFPYQMIKIDPTAHVKIPRKSDDKAKIKTITQEEFREILNLAKQLRYKLAFQIAFHTGMRIGEVCALTWDNVNLITGEIHIRHNLIFAEGKFISAPLKTKFSIRDIKIGKTLIEILKEEKIRQTKLKEEYKEYYFQDKRDFVCCHDNGKPVLDSSIQVFCHTQLKRKGINFNFHMLRHTHATMLLEAGANPKGISVRLGHSNIRITLDTYSHVTEKMKNDTVDIFENLIE
jgi:integrase